MYISLENKLVILVLYCLLISCSNALAFNEFQSFIELKSGKQLNCAYCHSHTNGPNGNEIGQLGSLSEGEKQLTAGRYKRDSYFHKPNSSKNIAKILASVPLYRQKHFHD